MKAIVAVLALAVAVSALQSEEVSEWVSFKHKYNRQYSSHTEEAQRYAVFLNNLKRAKAMQAENTGAVFGVTKFSDLTQKEFLARYTGLNETTHKRWINSLPTFNRPAKSGVLGSDWVAKGLVTRVKNQMSCGSCWAFSAAAAAEGCYASKYGKTQDLSAAQITDCCKEDGSDGCNGGQEDACLKWAMDHDIATWDSYTYDGSAHKCKDVTVVGLKAHTCTYYKIGEPATEKKMTDALTHSTVAVAVDATILQTYVGGILSTDSDCEMYSLNHAVLLVSDEGKGNSYVVKNSWDVDWGENGYFRVVKGKDCLGVADDVAVAY